MANFKVSIEHDSDCASPRECDNLGTMALFHRRYSLANENSLTVEQAQAIENDPTFAGVCLPVYMYDHSGVVLSTSPFSCPWDSGRVGIIFAPGSKLVEEYGAEWREKYETICGVLRGEVDEYGKWMNGECYGYVVKNEAGEVMDSCWGFVGEDSAKEAGDAALKVCEEAEQKEVAVVGSRWKRADRSVDSEHGYTVLYTTNTAHLSEKHPPQVVYRGDNGHVWSMARSEWPGNLVPE